MEMYLYKTRKLFEKANIYSHKFIAKPFLELANFLL